MFRKTVKTKTEEKEKIKAITNAQINGKTKTEALTKIRMVFSIIVIFAAVLLFSMTAAAETIQVSNGQEFRSALDTINGNGDSDNTIVLLNDIEISEDLFTEDEFTLTTDFGEGQKRIVGMNYNKSGTLTIQSNSSDARRIYSTFTKTDYCPGFNVSEKTTVSADISFNDVILDGCLIYLRNMTDSTIQNAQVINCNYSGIGMVDCNQLTLENVSVSNCSNGFGAGLYILSSENLIIRNCNIVNNTASYPAGSLKTSGGGGVYMVESSVDICGRTNICGNTIISDTDVPAGGGIAAFYSYLKIYDQANISDNTIDASGNLDDVTGGGIYAVFETSNGSVPGLEISDYVFISNNSAAQGGGIYVYYEESNGGPYVFNISGDVIISNNTAIVTDAIEGKNRINAKGGGIASLHPVNISGNVVIQNNKAVDLSSPELGDVLSTGGGIDSGISVNLSDNVHIIGNTAGYGGGIFSKGTTILQNNVLITGNKADYDGGGIFLTGPLTLWNNSTISQNDAAGNGGGLYLLNSNAEISGSVIIRENTAGFETAGGGGILITNNSVVNISDDVLISDNRAPSGGGIFSQGMSYIYISDNVTFEKNIADSRYGFGGAVLLLNSNAEVSGDSGQTVSFNRNTAAKSGGAVFIFMNGYEDPADLWGYQYFQKTTDDSALVFSGNVAKSGFLWNTTDPESEMTPAMIYISENYLPIENTTSTAPFSNIYNNFDIVYISGGQQVDSVEIPIQYFKDSWDLTDLLEIEYFYSYIGAELTEADISSEFEGDWVNYYRMPGYGKGQMYESLPLTVDADTYLNILYMKENNSSGPGPGGGGTGTATVTPPSDSGPEPPENTPENPNSGAPEQDGGSTKTGTPAASIIIILLFMIAVACYAYVEREESEEDQQYLV